MNKEMTYAEKEAWIKSNAGFELTPLDFNMENNDSNISKMKNLSKDLWENLEKLFSKKILLNKEISDSFQKLSEKYDLGEVELDIVARAANIGGMEYGWGLICRDKNPAEVNGLDFGAGEGELARRERESKLLRTFPEEKDWQMLGDKKNITACATEMREVLISCLNFRDEGYLRTVTESVGFVYIEMKRLNEKYKGCAILDSEGMGCLARFFEMNFHPAFSGAARYAEISIDMTNIEERIAALKEKREFDLLSNPGRKKVLKKI